MSSPGRQSMHSFITSLLIDTGPTKALLPSQGRGIRAGSRNARWARRISLRAWRSFSNVHLQTSPPSEGLSDARDCAGPRVGASSRVSPETSPLGPEEPYFRCEIL